MRRTERQRARLVPRYVQIFKSFFTGFIFFRSHFLFDSLGASFRPPECLVNRNSKVIIWLLQVSTIFAMCSLPPLDLLVSMNVGDVLYLVRGQRQKERCNEVKGERDHLCILHS